MKRRLVKAYDRMTMPDGCSQRIERMLERELRNRKKENGKWTMELAPAPRRNWWATAAGIVCLVLVLSAGGTSLFLNAMNHTAARTPEQAASQSPVTETTAQTTGETDTTVEYAKDGLSFRYPAEWHLELADDMEQFYNGQRLAFWLVRRDAWEVNLELDVEGYQAMLRRDGYPDTVVTEVSPVSIDGMEANKVVFTYLDGTITRYDTATEDAGYSFCFAYFHQNGQTDTMAEEALMASVRFGAEDENFVLSDQGREFLQKMCYYMPDWADDASADEDFWRQLLFASFTSPELTGDGKALTIAGEAEYLPEGLVKVSREAVADYIMLAMGCELPEFAPAYEDMEPGQTALYYEDGYYYIGSSDFGSVGYTFRKWEPDMDAYPTLASASFDAYIDEPENVIGTVTFRVYPAESGNGFTIIGKEFKTYTRFSLNGEDYPFFPIVQDFIDRGWELEKATSFLGDYTQSEGVSNLLPDGYRLTSGENYVRVMLDEEDCRNGLEPSQCRVVSLELYGENVESFYLNGSDLAGIDENRLVDALGNSYSASSDAYGKVYTYQPGNNISYMTFAFPRSSENVSEIFVIFEQD